MTFTKMGYLSLSHFIKIDFASLGGAIKKVTSKKKKK